MHRKTKNHKGGLARSSDCSWQAVPAVFQDTANGESTRQEEEQEMKNSYTALIDSIDKLKASYDKERWLYCLCGFVWGVLISIIFTVDLWPK